MRKSDDENTTYRYSASGRSLPGDPELLTLRAARLLRDCAVVVYDHLVGEGVRQLIGKHVRQV